MSVPTTTSSATSMNFIGFEELKGQGPPELLYNQVFIEPNLPQSTGNFNLAAAAPSGAKATSPGS